MSDVYQRGSVYINDLSDFTKQLVRWLKGPTVELSKLVWYGFIFSYFSCIMFVYCLNVVLCKNSSMRNDWVMAIKVNFGMVWNSF